MALQLAFLVASLFGSAADVYLAQSAAGSADGSSCANARAYTYFNTVGNWGAGATQIGPGTVVHICGTISIATINTNALIFRGSGSPGSPITVRFEQNAKLTSPAWPSPTGAIKADTFSYILIDGNWTGEIIATDAGSERGNLTGGTAVAVTGSTNVEIRNLLISDLYVHTLASDAGPNNGTSGGCVYANGYGNNISIHGLVAHDVPWCVNLQSPSSVTNLQIYDNTMWRVDHGISIGYGSTANSLTGLVVRNNIVSDVSNWDTTVNQWHHDFFHAYNLTGGGVSGNWTVSENLCDGDWGANNTAHVYVSVGLSGITISDNDFRSRVKLNNGMVGLGPTITSSPVRRNFFYCDPSVPNAFGGTFGQSDSTWTDNVFYGCSTYILLQSGGNFAALDNNVYVGSLGGGNGLWNRFSTAYNTLGAWQTATGFDANSTAPASLGVYERGALTPTAKAFDRAGAIAVTNTATGRKMSFGGTPRADRMVRKMRVYFGNPTIQSTTYCEALAVTNCFLGGVSQGGATLNLTGFTKYQIRYLTMAGVETFAGPIGDL